MAFTIKITNTVWNDGSLGQGGTYRDSTLEEFRGPNRNYFEPVFHPRKPLDVEGLKAY